MNQKAGILEAIACVSNCKRICYFCIIIHINNVQEFFVELYTNERNSE